MGRLHSNLKRIFEKSKVEGSQEVYQDLLQKFVTLMTYEDTYLMQRMNRFFVLKESAENMFIDCGGFGVIVTPQDVISIHT